MCIRDSLFMSIYSDAIFFKLANYIMKIYYLPGTCSFPVSYTHLDVYKRQVLSDVIWSDFVSMHSLQRSKFVGYM